MKLALLPPPKEAGYMLETDYQLLLPSFMHSPEYRAAVRALKKRGDYIILDNGAAEGHTLSATDLWELAEVTGASEIVVPDVMHDAQATWGLVKNFKPSRVQCKYMAVLTGKTHDDVRWLLDQYVSTDWIDTIGIPRLLPGWGVSRAWVTGLLEDYPFDIHWLGMNPHHMYEVFTLHQFDGIIRGVDSSAPFNYALQKFSLEQYAGATDIVVNRPRDYTDKTFDQYIQRLRADKNVHWLKGQVYGKAVPSFS